MGFEDLLTLTHQINISPAGHWFGGAYIYLSTMHCTEL